MKTTKPKNEIAIKCAYTDMVATDEVTPRPKNPNKHPPKQIALLARMMRRVGIRSPITVSKLSGYVVRGHGRLEACKALKMPRVPVDFQDYADEAEEMADLMADNRIPELAELDLSAAWKNLGSIADEFKLEDLGFLKSEFKDVNLQALIDAPFDDALAESIAPPKVAEVTKTTWAPVALPSSSRWGIPDMRLDMIPDDFDVVGVWCNREQAVEPGLLYLWGTNRFPEDCKGGLCAFYVDDARFEGICRKHEDTVAAAEKLMACKFAAAVSPNWSLWRNMPHAVMVYRTYCVRYVARYWQEMGLKVVPDINWADEQSFDFCFDGIPHGTPVASIQCRTTNTGTPQFAESKKYFLKGLKVALERIAPKKLLIYGGVEHRKWIEPNVEFGATVPVYLDSWKGARGRK
ncbi:MAG: DUF4417 domain-containing protein [Kiritimatiellae bacterium]|nr:DUF4417 domain-containing protein [Kiritimatiellia bacterium]